MVVYTKKSGPHTRIIDGGSGYLCEMEPVAHFGLGKIAFQEPQNWAEIKHLNKPHVLLQGASKESCSSLLIIT